VNATLILAAHAALAAWAGSLYVHPFGRCGKCGGRGTIRSGRRRVKVCPRCKGRRRVQRRGSRTVHRLAFKIRDGQRAAAKYQEDSHGDS
jgi:DnaJ-class molecular chaperone